ncbi:MAG: hypothetical protein ACE5R7_08830, partial [Nitrosarchaeum sp.]
DEALSRGITASVHTSVYNKGMYRIMEKLGYAPEEVIRDYEKYRGKIKAKDFDVYAWTIRPN